MAIGIQIKKPDHVSSSKPVSHVAEPPQDSTLSPVLYVLLLVSFPASAVAIYFFVQARLV